MIDVVVVTYNSRNEIRDCIDSLLSSPQVSSISIVDNASVDDTAAVVQAAKQYDARGVVHYYQMSANLGLAEGNNVGAVKGSAEHLLILNPDTIASPNTLEELSASLVKLDACAVGPVNLDPDGTPHSSFHRQWTLLHAIAWRVVPFGLTSRIYRLVRRYDQSQPVSFVSGSCLMTKRSYFEQIGGYDPKFYLCVEDVADLCKRLRDETGKPVYLVSSATIKHLKGRSHDKSKEIVLIKGATGGAHYQRKHNGLLNAGIFKAMIFLGYGLRMVVRALSGEWNQVRSYAKAIRQCITF